MKKLENLQNVTPPGGNYPYGDLKDNTGTNNGTPVNRDLLTDLVQFAQKIANEAGITINDLPDNDSDGWQLYEAFKKLTRPYKLYSGIINQSGTSAPYVTENVNEFGSIVWTRLGVGVYKGTLTGAFVGSRIASISGILDPTNIAKILVADDDTIIISTYIHNTTTNTFVPTDNVLIDRGFELKVF